MKFRDRLKKWFPTFWRLFFGAYSADKTWSADVVSEKQDFTVSSPADNVSVQPIAPFILGLSNLEELESLLNENFLNLMRWDASSKSGQMSQISESLLGELSIAESLSTEAVLKAIQWDSDTVVKPSKPQNNSDSGSLFLLGLDDFSDIDNLLNADLFQILRWEAEGQTVLPVASEDIELLEDLLESFPEE